MILLGEGLFLVELVLLVYCLLDVIRTPEADCRNLPKVAWIGLVVVLPLAGGVAWLAAGRPASGPRPVRDPRVPPEYDRPGRATAFSPDDDAAFLASLRERAEEQRRKAAEEARRLRAAEDEPPQA